MTCGVYVIQHDESGRLYVGKSIDIERRMLRHFGTKEIETSKCHVHRAMAKYGKDAFSWWIIEAGLSPEAASTQESYWIQHLDTRSPKGFNLTDGGEGAPGAKPVRNAEFKAKISKAKRGFKHSADTKKRMSLAHKGRTFSVEHRAKMSEYAQNRTEEHRNKLGATWRGKTHSPETRAKISATKRRQAAERANHD